MLASSQEDTHDHDHRDPPQAGQQQPQRVSHRPRLHVAVRRLRQERRCRSDPRHPSRARSRRDVPRQLRHVRLGPQRDAARQGARRRPARQGRARHQVRPDAEAGRRQWRRRQPRLREGGVRGEPQAAGRRRDRSLLPAPRRSLGADRGHGGRHGRAREGGQGAGAGPERSAAGNHPPRPQGPSSRGGAERILAALSRRMPRRRSRPRARSASPSSPTRRSAAAC